MITLAGFHRHKTWMTATRTDPEKDLFRNAWKTRIRLQTILTTHTGIERSEENDVSKTCQVYGCRYSFAEQVQDHKPAAGRRNFVTANFDERPSAIIYSCTIGSFAPMAASIRFPGSPKHRRI